MADTKITDLTAITGATVASTDVVPLVDVSDTTMAASGTNKKITAAELVTAIKTLGALDDASLAELIRDTVGTALVAGSNVTITPNDGADTITIAATGGGGGGDLLAANNLSDVANAATARANLGLVIGTDVQAQDAELSAIAGLTSAADRLPYFTGSGTAALATFTTAGRNLIDDADASAQRTTLGLGSIATQAANSVSITGGSISGITDLAVADGGTGASDAATARTNLGVDYTTLDERTRDTIGTALVAGSNVTITPNDGADTITIAASGGGGSSALPSMGRGLTSLSTVTSQDYYAVPGFAPYGSPTTLTAVADTLYYYEFAVDSAIQVTDLACWVTTGAGTTGRMGIVAIDPSDRQPLASGGVQVQGTFDPSSTGIKTLTGLTTNLSAGLYVFFLVSNGATVFRLFLGARTSGSFRLNQASNTAISGRTVASVGTGALSDPAPDYTAVTNAAGHSFAVVARWTTQ